MFDEEQTTYMFKLQKEKLILLTANEPLCENIQLRCTMNRHNWA